MHEAFERKTAGFWRIVGDAVYRRRVEYRDIGEIAHLQAPAASVMTGGSKARGASQAQAGAADRLRSGSRSRG